MVGGCDKRLTLLLPPSRPESRRIIRNSAMLSRTPRASGAPALSLALQYLSKIDFRLSSWSW